MSETRQDSRERIIDAANRLIYQKGYNQTSFADVADDIGISKGNLHYHFRSKDDLLEAVIDLRKQLIQANLARWEEEISEPEEKLRRFVQMLLSEETELVRYGCPMGTLNMELGKYQQDMRNRAREMFDLFQAWLDRTFQQMGRKDSAELSRHLLIMAQGTALMTYVYSDASLLEHECNKMLEWVDTL